VIQAADLDWRDGQPYSKTFNDIYHDVDGVAEVNQVLLEPVGFKQLLAEGRRLLIGELGFGTGLNFAVIADHCLTAAVPLHFISVENAPLSAAEFRRVCEARQKTVTSYAELSEVYPPLLPGWHRRRLGGGLITLSLYWGDAAAGLSELVRTQSCPIDLWLLDGFAPARNPEMWTPTLLEKLATSSGRGTRISTFTSVGQVRRDLTRTGFRMRRVNQRPRKWESLAGSFEANGRVRREPTQTVRIVGAGIAGAATARELALSGINVEVFEAGAEVGIGASRIPVTVMHPRLHHDDSPAARLRAAAFTHAVAAMRPFHHNKGSVENSGLRATGALQLAAANYPLERLKEVAARYADSGLNVALKTAAEVNEIAGVSIDQPALWFADACLVHTPQLTRTLLDHPRIQVHTDSTFYSEEEGWGDVPTILACGYAAQKFPGAEYLELGPVHGQLDLVQLRGSVPRVPVVGQGYVAPLIGAAGLQPGLVGVGATYEYQRWPVERASAQNFSHLARLGCRDFVAHQQIKATRSVSSDRSPVIGPLHGQDQQALPGRWVSTGHGSMGTVSSHLGAALLDASLLGEVVPLDEPLNALVSPLRFRTRQARRGYRFGATS